VKTQTLLWHYTYQHRIEAILSSRQLIPTLGGGSSDPNEPEEDLREKKILWFSKNQVWEPASYRGYQDKTTGETHDLLKLEDYAAQNIRVFRIGVLGGGIIKPWSRLQRIAHVSPGMAGRLEEWCRSIGSNPFDWWGSIFPVPDTMWVSVQELKDGAWQELPRASESDGAENVSLLGAL
jgi:hypothetical protein